MDDESVDEDLVASLELLAVAETMLPVHQQCVDCGRTTGNFCEGWSGSDNCFAKIRVPEIHWPDMWRTPLCTFCEDKKACCKYCRRDFKRAAKGGRPLFAPLK